MAKVKRRRDREEPTFPALADLAPGCAFNPYRLFYSWSLTHALGGYRKVRAAAKWVWVVLAGEVYTYGWTDKTEREMAWRCGYSVRQYRRRLVELEKAQLVHRGMNQGYTSYVWLLWHHAFASCSPLPPDKVVWTPRTRKAGPPDKVDRTYRDLQSNKSTWGRVTVDKATSYRGSIAAEGRTMPPIEEKANGHGRRPITIRSLTLRTDTNLQKQWRSWPQRSREIRSSTMVAAFEQVEHFRQYLDDRNPQIAHTARTNYRKALQELSELGGMAFDGQRRLFP